MHQQTGHARVSVPGRLQRRSVPRMFAQPEEMYKKFGLFGQRKLHSTRRLRLSRAVLHRRSRRQPLQKYGSYR